MAKPLPTDPCRAPSPRADRSISHLLTATALAAPVRLALPSAATDPVRPVSLMALRPSLGVAYIWFGALKVGNVTPVASLVAGTVPWVDPAWFVPLLGTVEVVVGIALVAGRRLTTVSCVLVAHLTGTLLVLVMQPQVAFRHGNPLLLTTVGEFAMKNVALISAGLVLASRRDAPRARQSEIDLAG
jgi:putative oxidoreductase